MALRLRVAARCLIGQRLRTGTASGGDALRCASTWRSINVATTTSASIIARSPFNLDARLNERKGPARGDIRRSLILLCIVGAERKGPISLRQFSSPVSPVGGFRIGLSGEDEVALRQRLRMRAMAMLDGLSMSPDERGMNGLMTSLARHDRRGHGSPGPSTVSSVDNETVGCRSSTSPTALSAIRHASFPLSPEPIPPDGSPQPLRARTGSPEYIINRIIRDNEAGVPPVEWPTRMALEGDAVADPTAAGRTPPPRVPFEGHPVSGRCAVHLAAHSMQCGELGGHVHDTAIRRPPNTTTVNGEEYGSVTDQWGETETEWLCRFRNEVKSLMGEETEPLGRARLKTGFWKDVEQRMKGKGFNRNADQCKNKFNTLLDYYRSHGSWWRGASRQAHDCGCQLFRTTLGPALALNLNLHSNRCLHSRRQTPRRKAGVHGAVEPIQVRDGDDVKDDVEAEGNEEWAGEFGDDDVVVDYENDDGEEEGIVSSLDGGSRGKRTADDGIGEEEEEEEEEDWDEEWSAMGDECLGGIDLGDSGELGKTALAVAEGILQDHPGFSSDFSLYGLQVAERSSSANIRVALDKLSDVYGAPTCEEMEVYLVLYWQKLKDEVRLLRTSARGARREGPFSQYPDPDDIHVEVTSPGVEREVKVPSELLRFKELPMTVVYRERTVRSGDGMGVENGETSHKKTAGGDSVDQNREAATEVEDEAKGREEGVVPVMTEWVDEGIEREEVLSFVEHDEVSGTTIWQVADVRLNREAGGRKGTKLTRKQRDRRIVIPLGDLSFVRLYLDF
ncbi:hypothetical protein CBR_g34365 [Chara braunii]|uniref:Myb-like domain-containing protein n=1 Tax=Chara braunii TaxID=69332 RepID=A0A388LIL4_CHABU|nr:hypothetical protein CBR_g34365 [Chara braunii]|eukprot:GBG82085.1 hypothetical protein CBR_g34365 [Chara braunii]